MLKIKSNDFLDLNRFGQFFFIFQMFFMLFAGLSGWLLVAIEIVLVVIFYFLSRKISSNYGAEFWVNQQNQWICKQGQNQHDVSVKDYWITRGYLFIWLKGSTKSVSIMLSRSIIGAQRYSQLLVLIKKTYESK